MGGAIVPTLAMRIVSTAISNALFITTFANEVATGASLYVCKKNKKSMMDSGDTSMQNFCSHVVNKSLYLLSKSRAKGFVSGKRAKLKFKKMQERKKRKKELRLKLRLERVSVE